MFKICKQNQENVKNKISKNEFDNVAASMPHLVDDIILKMYNLGITDCLEEALEDKRAKNKFIPFNLFLTLSIAAKMKCNTSITDIPFAISDHKVLAKLGYNIIDTKGNLKDGLMRESSIRFLLNKYSEKDFFTAYNSCVQEYILPKLGMKPYIHILDCSNVPVNFVNSNYEGATVATDKNGEKARGYKLSTLRGITGDTGVIEEMCFGDISTHDLTLSKEMVCNSSVFNDGDILINDRGFIDREFINYMKNERGVDTYVPLKSKMNSYIMAVSTAQIEGKWEPHPSRKKQKIALVSGLKDFWVSKKPEEDVDFNAAVMWDEESDNYFVFITTDTSKSARDIILTYELRPEIEEDYRQLKDFWNLSDFKSTKLKMIAFHLITTLFGYLFYQIYTMTPEGEYLAHKSLPVVLKNYHSKEMPQLIFYADNEFCILSITEFAQIFSQCDEEIQERLDYVFNYTRQQ